MTVTGSHPNEIKHILCLANSRKLSGRCIAGREILGHAPGPWIRPVGDREHQEVLEQERQYQDGSDPAVLDIIGVPLIRPHPHLFQQENWILDPKFYWEKRGRCDWSYLQSFVEASGPLWINHQSSHKGLNDRVRQMQAEALRTSLKLIRVRALTVEVFCPGAAFGNNKRRVQGRFEHGGTHYWFWVTDPLYERRYLAEPDGRYPLGECCLTISLSEPLEGFCYKLIAAVIERPQTQPR
jgi:hypothetical protein